MDRTDAATILRKHAGSAWKEVKNMKWLTELLCSISKKHRDKSEQQTQRINELENKVHDVNEQLNAHKTQMEEFENFKSRMQSLECENQELRETILALSVKHTQIKEKLSDRAHQLKQRLQRTQQELKSAHERTRDKDKALWNLTSKQKSTPILT